MGKEDAGSLVKSFEEQFARREEAIPGAFVVDLVPLNQASLPIYFNLGWNSDIGDYEAPLRLAYDSERRVLCAKFPEEPEDRKAEQILQILDLKKIRKAQLVAHSVGAISAALAAIKGASVFEKFTLINPAGLIPNDSPKDLIRRYINLLKELPGFARTAEVGSTQKIFDMARMITGFDMNKALREIVEAGVGVFTIHADGDTLFPVEKVRVDERIRKFTVSGGHYSIDQAMLLVLQNNQR